MSEGAETGTEGREPGTVASSNRPEGASDRGTDAGRCRICGNAGGNRPHAPREMMFGTRERFDYLECGACGCLQIVEVPDDLGRHYPPDYYSFGAGGGGGGSAGGTTRALHGLRNRAAVTGRGGLGRLLLLLKPAPILASLRPCGVGAESRILDVGSGAGALVRELRRAGFSGALGIDPYLEEDVPGRAREDGPLVVRRGLDEMEPAWDLVMFHHSFEHVVEPLGALRTVARLLAPGGTCLIRMPNAGSEAWRRYGTDWVQLDAPRHLHVHTPESLEIAAAAAGLRVRRVIHDSTDFQFWGSEQYRRDIPLFAPESHAVDPSASAFTKREIRRFRREAARLNARGLGDQAAFYLERDEGRDEGRRDEG